MASSSEGKIFSKDEVSRHNVPADLWIIYEGKVYDMTKYYHAHPGGDAMLRKAGKDVSYVLPTVSSHRMVWNFIARKLEEFCIGTVE